MLGVLIALYAACSSSDKATPTPSPVPTPPEPQQATEIITARSSDSILFDVRLSGVVFDHDHDGSFRDEIEVLSPESGVEFQGHFPSSEGDLVIVSCFATECQDGKGSATFTVRYWKAP